MSSADTDPWDELDDLAVSESRFIVDEIKRATKEGKTEVVIRGFITPASVQKLQQKHYDVSQSISGEEREVCTIIHLIGRCKRKEFTARKEDANTIRHEYAHMGDVHFC